MKKTLISGLLAMSVLGANNALAQESLSDIKREIRSLKRSYEKRISNLEGKLDNKQSNSSSFSGRKILGNSFNPSIGIILNGKYASYSRDASEMKGFAISHEGERGEEGFSLGESELNFSSNIDDKFYGSLTAAIVREDGEDKIELEEAYVKTRPEFGLPTGMNLKFGRAFWNIGYLNEHHAHSDDFADRPLPYRVFLNKAYNDDGLELSYVLPTDFYFEVGGGLFGGNDFPSGSNSNDGFANYSAYARTGGDISDNQNWRLGLSMLKNNTTSRVSNDTNFTFAGDSDLYAVDLRYEFTPTGNAKNSQIILQGEYFTKNEKGTYDVGGGAVALDEYSSGWYGQAVYKFLPNWRVGYRYTALDSHAVPSGLQGTDMDSEGHNPYVNTVMADWTNSEFSRVRLQYNHDRTLIGKTDNQVILQYVVSIGAHGSHKY